MTSHCGQCLETPDKTKYKQKSMHQAGRTRTETWRVQTPAGVHTHTRTSMGGRTTPLP